MNAQQVRELVGKPVHVQTGGLHWSYGDRTSPNVFFNNDPVGFRIEPGVVQAYDGDNSRCDGDTNALVEAANALSLEGSSADRTTEVPVCIDAGIRIQAFVERGMTPEEVRALVSKPIQQSAGGINWQYDRIDGPSVTFFWETRVGVITPVSVYGWDSRVSRCD